MTSSVPEPESPNPIYTNQSVATAIGSVYMANGVIGLANSAPGQPPAQRASGPVPYSMISAARERYAPPRAHADALAAVRDERVVVLYGPQGVGKRTGALNLLLDADPGLPLVMLLPDQTLEELATGTYDSGTGYLVFGWSGEDAASDGGDVSLGGLLERIQTAKAYLVITSERPLSGPQSPVIPHIGWTRPPVEDVLQVYGTPPGDLAPGVLEAHTLADVVQYARNLAEGLSPAESLSGLDLAQRRDVEQWFDGDPSPREILEAAALCFLDGLPERTFESWFAALADAVIPPPETPQEGAPPAAFAQTRRRSKDSLIHVRKLAADAGDAIPGQTRRCVLFKKEGYRAHVLSELYDRLPADFWTPLFGWLHEIVKQPDPHACLQTAHGLALLARDDFDSVRESFLQPWSADERDWRGWTAATLVLWSMCFEEELAPLARQTAIRWSRSRKPHRKRAATLAFSGAVGALYPADTLRHLWRLTEDGMTSESASSAIILLYFTLSNADGDGHLVVLEDLLQRVGDPPGRGSPRLLRTLSVLIGVLSAAEEGAPPLAVRHLRSRPQDVPVFARLWAASMINRPSRTAVFDTLYDVLNALGRIDPVPEDLLRDLLRNLAQALPAREHEPFKRDFERHITRRKNGEDATRLFVTLLRSIFSSEDG